MKRLVAEWIEKAEGDFATAEREYRVRRKRNLDAVCFHAQQCAEKYLKARLVAAARPFSKVHDLVALIDSVLPDEPLWGAYRESLARLSAYAVEYRYPGDAATIAEARESIRVCRAFRAAARVALGASEPGESDEE